MVRPRFYFLLDLSFLVTFDYQIPMYVKLGELIGSDRIGFGVCLSWPLLGGPERIIHAPSLSVVFGPGPIIPLCFL